MILIDFSESRWFVCNSSTKTLLFEVMNSIEKSAWENFPNKSANSSEDFAWVFSLRKKLFRGMRSGAQKIGPYRAMIGALLRFFRSPCHRWDSLFVWFTTSSGFLSIRRPSLNPFGSIYFLCSFIQSSAALFCERKTNKIYEARLASCLHMAPYQLFFVQFRSISVFDGHLSRSAACLRFLGCLSLTLIWWEFLITKLIV